MKKNLLKPSILLFSTIALNIGCTKTEVAPEHVTSKSVRIEDVMQSTIQSITASTFQTGNEPADAGDGDENTRWSGQGVGQTLTFTLKASQKIAAISVKFPQNATLPKSYKFDVRVSSDNSSWQTVKANLFSNPNKTFTNDPNAGVTSFQTFNLSTVASTGDAVFSTAKYVQIVGKGSYVNGTLANDFSDGTFYNDWNSFNEVVIHTANQNPFYNPNDPKSASNQEYLPFSNSSANFGARLSTRNLSNIRNWTNFDVTRSGGTPTLGGPINRLTIKSPFYTDPRVDVATGATGITFVSYDAMPDVVGGPNTNAKTPNFSAKFDLLASQSQVHTEVVLGADPLATPDGPTESWYGMSIFIPENFETDINDGNYYDYITQWHAHDDDNEGARNPPLGVVILNGKLKIINYWHASEINSNFSNNVDEQQGKKVFTLGDVRKGKWMHWVWHFVWDYRPYGNGRIQAWVDGVNVLDDYGPNKFNDDLNPYLKAGVYKRNWGNGITKRTLYMDEIYQSLPDATFEDVRTDQ